jgi:hypothetical protein
MTNTQNTRPTTLSQTKLFTNSRLHTCNYQVPAPWPKIAESLDPILENPNIPPFLKWAFQAVTIAFANPRTRRGLFRALFLLAWRSFAIRSKPDQVDPAFEHFYKQAILIDKPSVAACLKKLRYPGKI